MENMLKSTDRTAASQSDSDSGDSLFVTQSATSAKGTKTRRGISQESSDKGSSDKGSSDEGSGDEDDARCRRDAAAAADSSSDTSDIDYIRIHKILSSYLVGARHRHIDGPRATASFIKSGSGKLSIKQTQTLFNAEVGGFFKCVEKLKKEQDAWESSHFLCPLFLSDRLEEHDDDVDIKKVDVDSFILMSKKKHRDSWRRTDLTRAAKNGRTKSQNGTVEYNPDKPKKATVVAEGSTMSEENVDTRDNGKSCDTEGPQSEWKNGERQSQKSTVCGSRLLSTESSLIPSFLIEQEGNSENQLAVLAKPSEPDLTHQNDTRSYETSCISVTPYELENEVGKCSQDLFEDLNDLSDQTKVSTPIKIDRIGILEGDVFKEWKKCSRSDLDGDGSETADRIAEPQFAEVNGLRAEEGVHGCSRLSQNANMVPMGGLEERTEEVNSPGYNEELDETEISSKIVQEVQSADTSSHLKKTVNRLKEVKNRIEPEMQARNHNERKLQKSQKRGSADDVLQRTDMADSGCSLTKTTTKAVRRMKRKLFSQVFYDERHETTLDDSARLSEACEIKSKIKKKKDKRVHLMSEPSQDEAEVKTCQDSEDLEWQTSDGASASKDLEVNQQDSSAELCSESGKEASNQQKKKKTKRKDFSEKVIIQLDEESQIGCDATKTSGQKVKKRKKELLTEDFSQDGCPAKNLQELLMADPEIPAGTEFRHANQTSEAQSTEDHGQKKKKKRETKPTHDKPGHEITETISSLKETTNDIQLLEQDSEVHLTVKAKKKKKKNKYDESVCDGTSTERHVQNSELSTSPEPERFNVTSPEVEGIIQSAVSELTAKKSGKSHDDQVRSVTQLGKGIDPDCVSESFLSAAEDIERPTSTKSSSPGWIRQNSQQDCSAKSLREATKDNNGILSGGSEVQKIKKSKRKGLSTSTSTETNDCTPSLRLDPAAECMDSSAKTGKGPGQAFGPFLCFKSPKKKKSQKRGSADDVLQRTEMADSGCSLTKTKTVGQMKQKLFSQDFDEERHETTLDDSEELLSVSMEIHPMDPDSARLSEACEIKSKRKKKKDKRVHLMSEPSQDEAEVKTCQDSEDLEWQTSDGASASKDLEVNQQDSSAELCSESGKDASNRQKKKKTKRKDFSEKVIIQLDEESHIGQKVKKRKKELLTEDFSPEGSPAGTEFQHVNQTSEAQSTEDHERKKKKKKETKPTHDKPGHGITGTISSLEETTNDIQPLEQDSEVHLTVKAKKKKKKNKYDESLSDGTSTERHVQKSVRTPELSTSHEPESFKTTDDADPDLGPLDINVNLRRESKKDLIPPDGATPPKKRDLSNDMVTLQFAELTTKKKKKKKEKKKTELLTEDECQSKNLKEPIKDHSDVPIGFPSVDLYSEAQSLEDCERKTKRRRGKNKYGDGTAETDVAGQIGSMRHPNRSLEETSVVSHDTGAEETLVYERKTKKKKDKHNVTECCPSVTEEPEQFTATDHCSPVVAQQDCDSFIHEQSRNALETPAGPKSRKIKTRHPSDINNTPCSQRPAESESTHASPEITRKKEKRRQKKSITASKMEAESLEDALKGSGYHFPATVEIPPQSDDSFAFKKKKKKKKRQKEVCG